MKVEEPKGPARVTGAPLGECGIRVLFFSGIFTFVVAAADFVSANSQGFKITVELITQLLFKRTDRRFNPDLF
jgi:hypothetical protein